MAAIEEGGGGKVVEAVFVAENAGVQERLKLGAKAEGLLKSIMKNAVKAKENAKTLRALLEEKGIVNDLTTYTEVKANSLLLKTFTALLGAGLETDISKSKFGAGVVSDFMLFNNCFTNKQLQAFIALMNLSNATVEALKKSRDKLVRLVARTRESLLEDMEFAGGAEVRSHKAKPIVKNAEEAMQIVNAGVAAAEAAAAVGQKRAFDAGNYRDTDDEDYEDEDEEGGERKKSSSSSSSSSGSISLLKGKVDKVLKWFPDLENGAHLYFRDGEIFTKYCDEKQE